MVRYLTEQGLDAQSFETEYGDETAEAETHMQPEQLSAESETSTYMDINKATV